MSLDIMKSNIKTIRSNHNIRKERNRLWDSNKGIVLFWAAQNLCYLMKAKMQLKGEIHDTLDATAYDIDVKWIARGELYYLSFLLELN